LTLPASDERWNLTERVLASTLFERSPRLRSFLRYICECELSGKREQINEHAIGVQVFSRPPTYNPGDDSIVRSQARLLRQRLEEYFRTAGVHEPLRIIIPKGSYVPFFEASSVAVAPAEPALALDEEELPQAPPRSRRVYWLGAACLLLVLLAAVSVWIRRTPLLPNPQQRFWASLFSADRSAIIVPADSTLVLLEELTGQPVHLADYLSRQYLASMVLLPGRGPLSAGSLADSQYTSMADLNLVWKMMRNTTYARDHAEVRYARDLSISDAKENNLVLIGGARANPWVELFAGNMNLYVDYDWKTGRNLVINKKPNAGEAPIYAEDAADPQHRVYGLVAFLPSLDRQGHTLLVAGTSAAGTEAAADFLLSGTGLDSFFKRLEHRSSAIPHFELLLEAQSVGGKAPQSSVIAYRLLP
jgi:hypothetical protein